MSETTHDLKLWPEFFDAVVSGCKTFEVRDNDRGFENGDILHLQEYEPDCGHYTGAECWMRVVYVCAIPMTDDMVGMSIEPLTTEAEAYTDLAADPAYQAECDEWMNAPMGRPETCPTCVSRDKAVRNRIESPKGTPWGDSCPDSWHDTPASPPDVEAAFTDIARYVAYVEKRNSVPFGVTVAVRNILQPLATIRTALSQAYRERDLAIAHDRQPYPTAWAYEQVCKALHSKEDALSQANTAREKADDSLEAIKQLIEVAQRRNRDIPWSRIQDIIRLAQAEGSK